MKPSYFKSSKVDTASWIEITREERYFCFELYQSLKDDQKSFLSLIHKGIIRDPGKVDQPSLAVKHRLDFLENIDFKTFDFGVEVCFYRDLLKWHKPEISVGSTGLLHILVKLSRSFLHKLSSLFQLQKKLQKA